MMTPPRLGVLHLVNGPITFVRLLEVFTSFAAER